MGSGQKAQIRPATPEDAERCGEIAVLAWQRVFDTWRDMLGDEVFTQHFPEWQARKRQEVAQHVRQHPELAIVSVVEGVVAGFLTFHCHPEGGWGEIGNNAVDPAYQGYGVGTGQCAWALDKFRAEGLSSATVYTGLDEGHAPARTMYVKAGFDLALPHIRFYKKL